jgi:hypothetical protein
MTTTRKRSRRIPVNAIDLLAARTETLQRNMAAHKDSDDRHRRVYEKLSIAKDALLDALREAQS